jgi:cell division protein FtsI (penicillin-binding protein 3)
MANSGVKSKIKDTFIQRSWGVWAGLVILSVAVLFKMVQFQTTKKEKLLSSVKNAQMKERIIDAKRGNIYASDGTSILATSTPEYKMILDPSVAREELFSTNIDEFCAKLSRFFKDKSAEQYKEKIVKARRAKSRYLVLSNKRLTYADKSKLEEFPFFKQGSIKGGGYFEEKEIRFHPYNTLAERTIGNLDKKESKKGATGIEAEFNTYLSGTDGKGFYERLPGGYNKPVTLESDIASTAGLDVVTTLDVNFQDIAESALRKRIGETQAKYGSVAVMEVETGEIKAIANLTRHVGSTGEIYYLDDVNYAVSHGTDPGSTFKLASILAILEKSDLKPSDYAVNCKGQVMHGRNLFTCSHAHGDLTVQEVFEKSCNVGVYALMKRTFGFSKSDGFYDFLDKFRLTKATGFQLKGEPNPLVKNSQSNTFYGTTIPWMSIGYESRITPMQMLTFYNAVANDGYWVQPLLVKEIRSGNTVTNTFSANKISSAIASKTSIEYVKKMMTGVVKNGTARNINFGECAVAGKTGTAQKRVNGSYQKGLYYTSFIGYFPADKPKYTCVVVIDQPVGQNVYGGDVCAPVFKTIADKIYAYDMGMHKTRIVKVNTDKTANKLAVAKTDDQSVIARELGYVKRPSGDGWTKPRAITKDSVAWVAKDVEGNMKNLVGLTLRDALPILENQKYKVRHTGFGRVADVTLLDNRTVNLVLR